MNIHLFLQAVSRTLSDIVYLLDRPTTLVPALAVDARAENITGNYKNSTYSQTKYLPFDKIDVDKSRATIPDRKSCLEMKFQRANERCWTERTYRGSITTHNE